MAALQLTVVGAGDQLNFETNAPESVLLLRLPNGRVIYVVIQDRDKADVVAAIQAGGASAPAPAPATRTVYAPPSPPLEQSFGGDFSPAPTMVVGKKEVPVHPGLQRKQEEEAARIAAGDAPPPLTPAHARAPHVMKDDMGFPVVTGRPSNAPAVDDDGFASA